LVRGIVLSSRTRNYVLAARSFGASDLHVIREHIARNPRVLMTQATVLVPRYIAAEVTLSFFGRVERAVASWGTCSAP